METAPSDRSPHPALPQAIRDLLSACPTACALLVHERGTTRVAGVNPRAHGLLGLPDDATGPDFLDCFDDDHEHAFRQAVAGAAESGQPRSLRLVARRPGGGDPLLVSLSLSPMAAPADEAGPGQWLALHVEPAVQSAPHDRSRAHYDDGALRAALLAISRATHQSPSLEALFARIDRIIEQFVGTRNLYVALIDESDQMVRFAYQRDEYDDHRDRPLGRLGLTDIVYLTGRPLLVDRSRADRMLADGHVVNHGVPAQVWLGVPLRVSGRTVGVIAVQDYHNPHLFGESERQLLTFIADQVAGAIALRRAEAEAARAREASLRAAQAKRDFLAGMNHDLRSPLSIVLGYGEILAGQSPNPIESQQARCIVEAAQELQAMADRILEFSTLEAGARHAEPDWADLDELLLLCHSALFDEARRRNLSLTIKREGELPEAVHTDGDALRQMLVHLLDNAVRFTASGRVTLRVRALPLTPAADGHRHFVFSVEDTGPGLPKEVADQPFQPHATGPSTRRRPGRGFGLGLATAQRLGSLIGAKLQVETSAGVGTHIAIRLTAPARMPGGASQTAPDTLIEAEAQLRHRLEDRGGAILICGASDGTGHGLAGLVETITLKPPLTAPNGEVAAALSAVNQVDIVILDQSGGATEGPEMCARLHVLAPERGRPMILVNGTDHSVAQVDRWLKSGADQFLPQPLGRFALVTALLHALDRLDQRRLQGAAPA